MAKHAARAARDGVELAVLRASASVIDIRTRKPWRPPQQRTWPFLVDIAITFALVWLGSWLFHKMRGG